MSAVDLAELVRLAEIRDRHTAPVPIHPHDVKRADEAKRHRHDYSDGDVCATCDQLRPLRGRS